MLVQIEDIFLYVSEISLWITVHVKDKCETELQENQIFFHKANSSERRMFKWNMQWATIWVTELLISEASSYFPNLCFSVKFLKKGAAPLSSKIKIFLYVYF